jgi:predicted nucleic acid-binding protein
LLFLLDSNVVSELRKKKNMNPGVEKFFQAVDSFDLYLPVHTIGELRRGVENLKHRGDAPQAKKVEDWLNLIVSEYSDRIISFDDDCAQIWGRLMSPNNQNSVDKQIAAIGLIHGMTIVTRNVKHFVGTGATLSNPFI